MCLSAVFVAAAPGASTSWWSPGQGTPLPEFATYDNDQGQVGVLNVSGPFETTGHPFFEPMVVVVNWFEELKQRAPMK